MTNGPGQHFLGHPHTLANFETAFYRSETADNNSLRAVAGGRLARCRAARQPIWKRMLAEYEAPPIDPGIDEALLDYVARRKAAFPDSNV